MKQFLLFTLLLFVSIISCKSKKEEVEPQLNQQIQGSWVNNQVIREYFDNEEKKVYEITFNTKDLWEIDEDSVIIRYESGSSHSMKYEVVKAEGRSYVRIKHLSGNYDDNQVTSISASEMVWLWERAGSDIFYKGPSGITPKRNTITYKFTKK